MSHHLRKQKLKKVSINNYRDKIYATKIKKKIIPAS